MRTLLVIVMGTLGFGLATAQAQVVFPQATAPAENIDEPALEVEVAPAAPVADTKTQSNTSSNATSLGAPATATSPVSNVTTTVNPTIQVPQASQVAPQQGQVQQQQQLAPPSDADLIKNERHRKEGETDSYLQRRLEEGRMRDEEARREALREVSISARESESRARRESEERAAQQQQQQQQIIYAQAAAAQSNQLEATSEKKHDDDPFWRHISLTPTIGYTWYDNSYANNFRVDLKNNYTLGVQVGVPVSKFFSIVGGFTYADSDYEFQNLYPYAAVYNPLQFQKNQYIGSVDGRVTFMHGKFRPYINGGLNWIVNVGKLGYQYSPVQDTETFNYFGGDIGAGADVQVLDFLSVGAQFAYTTFFGQNNAYYFPGSPATILLHDAADMYRLMGAVTVAF
jgi:opacity protein-like surface antigen